jgi:hypothetical protein
MSTYAGWYAFILVVLFSVNFFSQAESGQAEKVIAELRGRPEPIELLCGPKGDAGPTGERGPQGRRGEGGVVDLPAAIDSLVNDPRLAALVRKAIDAKAHESAMPKASGPTKD